MSDSEKSESIGFGSSVRGLKWLLRDGSGPVVRSLSQKLAIPEVLASMIYHRGIDNAVDGEHFLSPKIKHAMSDPYMYKDMDKAVNRTIQAIVDHDKIAVFGDYDVDGATSTALLRRVFKKLMIDVITYIPHRLNEGYGLSKKALDVLHERGVNLVITVDCGMLSFEPVEYANSIGIDVIIIDHHLGLNTVPNAVAVVNPNRHDDTSQFKTMAAVGVVFMFVVALRSKLKADGWFKEHNIEEPDLIQYLDIVALGTVCDVMPLQGLNRAFVFQGLKMISKRQNIGIRAVSNVINLSHKVHVYHLGYVIGPRINAGGRIGEGILGSDLLSTDSYDEAYSIALQLEKLNEERKAIESIALEEAMRQVEDKRLYDNTVILVHSEYWHAGILGILASKLKEKYLRPVMAVLVMEEIAKGSARSIAGMNVSKAVERAKANGLLLEGGGHAMAAGFTLNRTRLEEFHEYINLYLANDKETALANATILDIDEIISLGALNTELLTLIERAGPFGQGNPVPRFAICDIVLTYCTIVGGKHILCVVSDGLGHSKSVKCMFFNGVQTKLGQTLLKSTGQKLSLAGTVQPNTFDDTQVSFVIEDAAFK
ncbi:single-stranded-DNA-specific exonuclease RecJ [Rickettsiales endosymbiont of Peranema trichophorum]|uniref:single-stranded-DNA-specific exonuclease RecJ n=1 Tax=Rickettsiales endosymbiont of Peranema trichophorum TaxID=2486577 RepID=UPI001023C075|nr:single-stranded-DNA-specific exonuclease RecJ [Rickettsiales endosymbiont of Peranema trichophorum]RZI47468.1 single-stranded-DNA-specific exonuclease RecJ [Rickettsiales endosymbiont of Peranema trichophorum]